MTRTTAGQRLRSDLDAALARAAEVRHCERMVHDLVARVHLGVGPAKAPQQQRAAQARWSRGHTPVRPGA